MIRKVLLSTLVILSVQQVSAQYRTGYEELYDSDTVRSLKEHVSFLSSALLEGRKAGSEGEQMAAEYLGKALEELRDDDATIAPGAKKHAARAG